MPSEANDSYFDLSLRDQLAPHVGQRLGFEATFDHYSRRELENGDYVGTLCFHNLVCRQPAIRLDHAWLDMTTVVWTHQLQSGDGVCFTARVHSYGSGPKPRYGLCDIEIEWIL